MEPGLQGRRGWPIGRTWAGGCFPLPPYSPRGELTLSWQLSGHGPSAAPHWREEGNHELCTCVCGVCVCVMHLCGDGVHGTPVMCVQGCAPYPFGECGVYSRGMCTV